MPLHKLIGGFTSYSNKASLNWKTGKWEKNFQNLAEFCLASQCVNSLLWLIFNFGSLTSVKRWGFLKFAHLRKSDSWWLRCRVLVPHGDKLSLIFWGVKAHRRLTMRFYCHPNKSSVWSKETFEKLSCNIYCEKHSFAIRVVPCKTAILPFFSLKIVNYVRISEGD